MNRNLEQKFRRKNNFHNNNSNNNPNYNNNNNANFNNNNSNFNNRNQNNVPIASRLGGNPNNQNNNHNNYNNNNNRNVGRNHPQYVLKSRDSRNMGRPFKRRRPNLPPNNRWSHRTNDAPNSDRWFKVTVPLAAKLEPTFVVDQIQQHGIQFTPFNYSINGTSVVFYVQGDDLVQSIKGLSRRISTPDGLKLIFQTEKSPLPLIDVTPEFVNSLKVVMSKRYDVNNKSLNLSQFASEPDFLSMRLYVSLQRINVSKEVVDIIIENIPDLVSLNLAHNRIQNIEVFKPLVGVCKNLKQIDLSYNNINNIEHFDQLKGLDLEVLNVDFNPFKKNIKDKSQDNYVRLIRARFPKVINLDGIAIPPPICFDVDDSTTVPGTKDTSIPDHLKDSVQNFVKSYFSLFDSDNRQQLSDHYYEQATFSFTINRFDSRLKHKALDMSLLNESRNLMRINENTREKLLRQGRAQIVSALSNLPKTEHILESFKIDVPIFESNYIVLNICGLYKNKHPYNLKAFSRNFFIVVHNSVPIIVNDMLSITNPSVDNINFFKNLYKNDPNSQDMNFMDSMDEMNDSMPIYQPDQTNTMINNHLMNPVGNNSIDYMHSPQNSINNNQITRMMNLPIDPNEQLIAQFCQVTKMNRNFSQKCLQENNYNAEVALNIFKTLNEKGLIPAEAFK